MRNKEMYSTLAAILFALILVVSAYFYGASNARIEYKEAPSKVVEKIVYDTVPIAKPPIYIKGKAIVMIDTVNQKDTVYLTKPFIARLDTIYKDTISVKYAYPLNRFDLSIRFKPDSIIQTTKIITEVKTVKEERPLWLDILSHLGAGAMGYLVGRAVK